MTGAQVRRIRREKLQLTQVELAEKLRVDVSSVTRWERGIVPVTGLAEVALTLLAAQERRARRTRKTR